MCELTHGMAGERHGKYMGAAWERHGRSMEIGLQSAELAMDRVDVSGEKIRLSISLRLAFEVFLHVTYKKIHKCYYLILYLNCCGQTGVL